MRKIHFVIAFAVTVSMGFVACDAGTQPSGDTAQVESSLAAKSTATLPDFSMLISKDELVALQSMKGKKCL